MMLSIFIVSDSTGETAERMVNSALVQFREAPVRMIRKGQIRTPEKIRALIREAAHARDSLVVHTLVRSDLRRLIGEEARLNGVDSMDLLGPVLERLVARLELVPRQTPGLLKQLMKAKSRKIEAVEYAFRHDDGQHIEELGKAEVVLVGVSRTMKTPTMLYLAYRGWFAANVPLIIELPVPQELLALPPQRVICLLATPSYLAEARLARARAFKIPEEPYASMEQVRNELRFSRQISRQHRWRQVEITSKSVEEVTREVIDLLPQKEFALGPAW